jgi:hypothetical protein
MLENQNGVITASWISLGKSNYSQNTITGYQSFEVLNFCRLLVKFGNIHQLLGLCIINSIFVSYIKGLKSSIYEKPWTQSTPSEEILF